MTIPPSNCFAKKTDDDNLGRQPLSIHMDNRRSSSDRPELMDELVQAEVNQGWVEQFDGTIEDAQTRWPTGVAVGRLGIAISDSGDPRLALFVAPILHVMSVNIKLFQPPKMY